MGFLRTQGWNTGGVTHGSSTAPGTQWVKSGWRKRTKTRTVFRYLRVTKTRGYKYCLCSKTTLCQVTVPERLRGWTRNPLGSACASSSLVGHAFSSSVSFCLPPSPSRALCQCSIHWYTRHGVHTNFENHVAHDAVFSSCAR